MRTAPPPNRLGALERILLALVDEHNETHGYELFPGCDDLVVQLRGSTPTPQNIFLCPPGDEEHR